MARHVTDIFERLNDKFIVDEVTGCWVWVGAVASSGYGKIGAGGARGKTRSAHRVAWEKSYGEIPLGLNVLHRCDNRLCVNPQHLFLGTQVDNAKDMISKGRGKWDNAAKGEKNGSSKLTEKNVREIRRLHSLGINTVELGKLFGVYNGTIGYIVRGVRWSHVK